MRQDSYIAVEYCGGVYSEALVILCLLPLEKNTFKGGVISILIIYVTWLALFGFSIIGID